MICSKTEQHTRKLKNSLLWQIWLKIGYQISTRLLLNLDGLLSLGLASLQLHFWEWSVTLLYSELKLTTSSNSQREAILLVSLMLAVGLSLLSILLHFQSSTQLDWSFSLQKSLTLSFKAIHGQN